MGVPSASFRESPNSLTYVSNEDRVKDTTKAYLSLPILVPLPPQSLPIPSQGWRTKSMAGSQSCIPFRLVAGGVQGRQWIF